MYWTWLVAAALTVVTGGVVVVVTRGFVEAWRDARRDESEEDAVAGRGKFVCVHCGQPCGVTGHVRAGTRQRPVCASTEPMYIVRDARGREFGFCCPPGHACMFGSTALVERRRRGDWRHDLMTPAQWDYLLALGYRGERPRTKGHAKDVIQQLLDGAFEGPPEAVRAIRVREGPDADFYARTNPNPPDGTV